MIEHLPPGVLLLVGAFVLPFLRGTARRVALVGLPVLSALHLLALPEMLSWSATLFDLRLTPVRVDPLSRVWGYVFHLAAILGAIYSLHERDEQATTQAAAMSYAGAAIAAVFSGDLLTLFVYWEWTAIASVFLIWAKPVHLRDLGLEGEYHEQVRRSERAGMRYLVIQVGSGVLLLAGILLRRAAGGSLDFGAMTLADPGAFLLFLAFGIKAAFPFLHNWLQDAYPEATPSGTVFLSAFTTKMAIYALARGFAGTESLVWIGAAMTAFPIFFAVIVNDLRRVLAYSLNNQLGFMVVGIGIGTELSLNGTAAHAFAHILYKALLFMSMGAVLHRVGTTKGSELGGLYKSMPWTAGFCAVGAASISAFPFFSGFVAKSLILAAVALEHRTVVWLVLLFASAGVFHHSGIKIPFFAFFAHDSGRRVDEAPRNMLVAMAITAILCVVLGVFPSLLYGLLPFDVDYDPYTTAHVIAQFQLLLFSALAFTLLNRVKVGGKILYPPELRSTVLDTDWTYRRLLPGVIGWMARTGQGGGRWLKAAVVDPLGARGAFALLDFFGPRGILSRTWPTGRIILLVVLMLGGYLLFYALL